MGEAELIGTVKEQAIDSSFSLDAGGQTVEVRFSGTVGGDTMEGTIDTGGFGGGHVHRYAQVGGPDAPVIRVPAPTIEHLNLKADRSCTDV